MSNEKTCGEFHDAKSELNNALIDFKDKAELDDRDMREEILDSLWDVFGKEFVFNITTQ